MQITSNDDKSTPIFFDVYLHINPSEVQHRWFAGRRWAHERKKTSSNRSCEIGGEERMG